MPLEAIVMSSNSSMGTAIFCLAVIYWGKSYLASWKMIPSV
jgi:hypothetical protein